MDRRSGNLSLRMAKSSSAKKVHKAAAAGGGRSARRSDRSLMFPVAMAVVVLVGVVLVFLGRQERIGSHDSSAPQIGDHFHSTYELYVCGEQVDPIPNDSADDRTGIHTHGDSLIHIHPFATTVTGTGANLGAFFDEVQLQFDDDTLELPDGRILKSGETECSPGQPGVLKVYKWASVSAQAPLVFEDHLRQVRLDQNRPGEGQLFTIAFMPADTPVDEIPRPDDAYLREYIGLPPADQPLDETPDGHGGTGTDTGGDQGTTGDSSTTTSPGETTTTTAG